MNRFANGIKLLSKSDMYKIHSCTLRILKEIGMEAHIPEGMIDQVKTCDGINLDRAKRRITFEEEAVLETIRQFSGAADAHIDENGTANRELPLRMPTRIMGQIGNYHGVVWDMKLGSERAATHDDIRNFVKIRQHLSDVVKTNIGLLPQDVPGEVAYIHTMAINAIYQGNASAGASQSAAEIKWINEICKVLGSSCIGSTSSLVPFIIPPLRIPEDTFNIVRENTENNQLTYIGSMSSLGGNGPVSEPGNLSCTYAEIFGANTISRLLAPSANNRFSPRDLQFDTCLFEPRKGNMVVSRPENLRSKLIQKQMNGQFYKFPNSGSFIVGSVTDSPCPNMQAAYDFAQHSALSLSSGFYSDADEISVVQKGLGRIQGNLCISAEFAILCHEMLSWQKRYFAELTVDDNTLAFEAIKEVGPGGSFLACEHTLEQSRESIWYPHCFYDGPHGTDLKATDVDPMRKATEMASEIYKKELTPVLDDGKVHEIQIIVKSAEKEILGSETGVEL